MNKECVGRTGVELIWFIGWLFTIGFAHLVWWKIILGIVVWPLYLGAVPGLISERISPTVVVIGG